MLPKNNIPWIPENQKQLYTEYAEADAWYSGDAARLANFYSGMIYPTDTVVGDFYSDIFNQTIAPRAKFWGKKIYEERRNVMHVPVAGDIARTSADLLFSESPKFTTQNEQTNEVLQGLLDDINVHNKLLEAAETCAAIGGVFLKINWDSDFSQYPFLSVVQPDSAMPEFEWGQLRAVTFWKDLYKEQNRKETKIYRLLERHERGKIEYGLYIGSEDNIGMRVGLATLPETANLPDEINTGINDLLVRYIPNMLPNRRHRGSNYGQSDFAGLESLMDALDETYTSWMRDVRLGLGRIMVPESFLQRLPNGELAFDVDREVFTPLDVDPLSSQSVGITNVQFEIRTQQHMDTCLELLHRIISSAGYSPQSFGLNIAGNESGTALNIRERKSFVTKSRKERNWKTPLEDIVFMLLQVYQIHLNGRVIPERPIVEFGDSIQHDTTVIANAVDLLTRAQSASIETKVRMVNPDWSDDMVMAEVDRIKEENGLAVPSPIQNGIG